MFQTTTLLVLTRIRGDVAVLLLWRQLSLEFNRRAQLEVPAACASQAAIDSLRIGLLPQQVMSPKSKSGLTEDP